MPEGSEYLAGARVQANYPISIPYHGLACNITVLSYQDNLDDYKISLGLGKERIVSAPVDDQGRIVPEKIPPLDGRTLLRDGDVIRFGTNFVRFNERRRRGAEEQEQDVVGADPEEDDGNRLHEDLQVSRQ